MRLVRMLQHNGVVPYLVFDGDYLPSKAATEEERKKSRAKSKAAGFELLKAGKGPLAWRELSKAVDVTPEMAKMLMIELKKANVQYIVAPYEADPQMVYLERKGIVSAILSEDSDLLVFGAKCLLTKLDKYGNCVSIRQDDFCACKDMDLTGWSEKQFRHMAILSGCDYLASVKGVGLLTAYRLMRKHKTAEQAIRMLQFDVKKNVPKDYLASFYRAELTFLHQRVFCPETCSLVHHTTPPEPLDDTTTSFIGIAIENKIAIRVATGELNPITKKPIVIMENNHPRNVSANIENNPSTPWTMAQKSYQRSLSSAGGGEPGNPANGSKTFSIKRMPLSELDVNLFTPSPSQQQALLRNSGDWLAVPSPRAGQRSTSTPNLRAVADAQSAPARALRAQISLNAVDLSRIADPQSEPRPQKRGRLCSDASDTTSPAASPNVVRSRFFDDVDSPSVRNTRVASKKHKAGIPIFKDEVVDEGKTKVVDEVTDTLPDAVEYPRDGSFSVIINKKEDNQQSVPGLTDGEFFKSVSPSTRFENDENAVTTPFGGRTTSGISPFIKQCAFKPAGSINNTPPSSGSRIPVPVKAYGQLGGAPNPLARRVGIKPIDTNTPRNNITMSNPLPTPPYTPGTPSYARNTASVAARQQQAKPKPRSSLGGLPFPEVASGQAYSAEVLRKKKEAETGHYKVGDLLPDGEIAGTTYGKYTMQDGKKLYKKREDIPYELRAKYDHGLNKWYEERELAKVAKEDEWKLREAPVIEYEAKVDREVRHAQGDVTDVSEADDVLSSPPAPNRRVDFGKFAFKAKE